MNVLGNKQLGSNVIDWPVYMQRALELAANVLTATPNPRVGCVLVKYGEVIGEGWHVAAGREHAEVMALETAGHEARGATAFVSLEPCSHSGRTGPCCDALIEAEVAQVVIAAVDPNPEVAGSGIEKLETAGIEVIHLVDFEAAARAINPGYFKRREVGMPFVRLKLAMSLDGRTALANGESKWITGSEARRDVQRLRACSSAIITGVNTVLIDDPTLNVRKDELGIPDAVRGSKEQPMRVILDSQLRTPSAAKIIAADGVVKIYTGAKNSENQDHANNVELLSVETDSKGVRLQSVLESLASDFSCNEVLVEAGATLSGELIAAGLVDELIVYIAPKLLGSDARPLFEIAGLESLADCTQLETSEVVQIGNDVRLTLIPKK